MNRRDIFKGASGAMAAVAISKSPVGHPGQQPASPTGPYPDDQMLRKAASLLPPTSDPLWEIKQVFRNKAAKERERLDAELRRKIDALSDIKSVSPAYRRYRLAQLFGEQEKIRQRFFEFCERL